MLGLNPDQPIRLPSRKTAWRIAGVGFAVYLALAAYIRYVDVGAPIAPDPLLSGCFEGEDGAEACFDWSEETDVPQLTLRISESESARTFIMSFDHRKPRTLMPGADPDRRALALRSLIHQNSFGRTVADATFGPRACRFNKYTRGTKEVITRWWSEGDCRDAGPGLRMMITREDDAFEISIDLDGQSYTYEDMTD